jgi:flagellin-specific chaperone FliS
MHTFTPEDLLQYLYDETSPAQTAAIKAALENDWSLREKFEVITSAQSKLEALKMSPSQQTIDNILNYAEKAVSELSASV